MWMNSLWWWWIGWGSVYTDLWLLPSFWLVLKRKNNVTSDELSNFLTEENVSLFKEILKDNVNVILREYSHLTIPNQKVTPLNDQHIVQILQTLLSEDHKISQV